MPDDLRPFLNDRRAALDRLTAGLDAYWNAAIAPHWPAMQAALDEEVLLRARALAADGPERAARPPARTDPLGAAGAHPGKGP